MVFHLVVEEVAAGAVVDFLQEGEEAEVGAVAASNAMKARQQKLLRPEK